MRVWTRSASPWRISMRWADGATRTREMRSIPPASFPMARSSMEWPGLSRCWSDVPEQFVSTVAEKLLMYGLGRNLQYYDAPAVRAIVRSMRRTKNYSFEALVSGVVKSPAFQMRANLQSDIGVGNVPDEKSPSAPDFSARRGHGIGAADARCNGSRSFREGGAGDAASGVRLHTERRDSRSVEAFHRNDFDRNDRI